MYKEILQALGTRSSINQLFIDQYTQKVSKINGLTPLTRSLCWPGRQQSDGEQLTSTGPKSSSSMQLVFCPPNPVFFFLQNYLSFQVGVSPPEPSSC